MRPISIGGHLVGCQRSTAVGWQTRPIAVDHTNGGVGDKRNRRATFFCQKIAGRNVKSSVFQEIQICGIIELGCRLRLSIPFLSSQHRPRKYQDRNSILELCGLVSPFSGQ